MQWTAVKLQSSPGGKERFHGDKEIGWGPSKQLHDQSGMGKQKGDSSSKEELDKWSHAKHKLENSAPAALAERLLVRIKRARKVLQCSRAINWGLGQVVVWLRDGVVFGDIVWRW